MVGVASLRAVIRNLVHTSIIFDIIIDIVSSMILVLEVLHFFAFVTRPFWGKVDLLTSRKQLLGYDQFCLPR